MNKENVMRAHWVLGLFLKAPMKNMVLITMAVFFLFPGVSFAYPTYPTQLPYFRDIFQTSQSVCLILEGYFSDYGRYRIDREMDGSSERIWDDKTFPEENALVDHGDGYQIHVLSDTCLQPGIATYIFRNMANNIDFKLDEREIEIEGSSAECTDEEDICLQVVDPEDYDRGFVEESEEEDDDDDGGCCGC